MSNPGPKLYFSQFGGLQPIPPEFLAAMNIRTEKQSVPNTVEPEPLTSEVIESKVETDRTNERVRTTIKVDEGPFVLRNIRTNDEGMPVQVTRTLFRTGTQNPEVPTITSVVAIADLGNGWSIQEVGVEGKYNDDGTFTPSIYQGIELAKERDDPVPERFRLAVPRTKTEEIVEGDAESPTLDENDLHKSERQLNFYKKILSTLTRDGIELPVILTNIQTDDKGELLFVTETYQEISILPRPLPSATQELEVIQLSYTHEVVRVTTKVVFTANEFSKQIPDLIPVEFRGLIPTTRTSAISTGTAAMPTLSAGVLEKSEKQVTKFLKLVDTLQRSGISFPVSLTHKKTITEYGGGEVLITRTIANVDTLTIDAGEQFVSSEIIKLGDGHEVKETISRVALSWPTLPGYDYDAEIQQVIPFTEQIVGMGSTTGGVSGDTITEVRPIDFVREKKIIRSNPTSPIDAFYRILENTTNVADFPVELTGITGYFEKTKQNGNYNEAGSYSLGGHGSGGVDLSGHCECAALVMGEVSFATRQPRGNSIPCKHVLMFMVVGSTNAQIRTRLGTIIGAGPVQLWPKFAERDVSILCKGERQSLRLQAAARAHSTTALDYNGYIVSVGESRSNGFGGSYELAINLKVVRLPPTIHGALSISTNTTTETASASCAIDTGAGGGGNLIASASVTATGTITPTSVPATTTGSGYINSYSSFTGLYLHRLITELDKKYNRLRVLAEVIDADDVGF